MFVLPFMVNKDVNNITH